MLVLASVTDSLVTFATHVVDSLGLAGVFLLMVPESACIPIPSEATMLFAGFTVASGHETLAGVVVAGVAGNVVGSWIAYGVGALGRTEVLERWVKPSHLEQADRWFERWGSWAVFFARMLPVVRTFISLPAGAARMGFARFTMLTLAGCIPYVLAFALIGREVGARWTDWQHQLHYVDYAVAALIVAAIAWLIVRALRRRARRRGASDAGEALLIRGARENPHR